MPGACLCVERRALEQDLIISGTSPAVRLHLEPRITSRKVGPDTSVATVSHQKVGHGTDVGSVPLCGIFFSLCQLSAQTLLQRLYSLCVYSHASASARRLKIPSTCSHASSWHTSILHNYHW